MEKIEEKVSIIIPNYNGRHLLEKNLPLLLKAIKRHNQQDEIIVIDNGSTDGSVEFLRNLFPVIKTIQLNRNLGFGEACNTGIRQSQNKIFILLNNDVEVTENFILPLLRHFSDRRIFSVSALSLGSDNKIKKSPGKPVDIPYASGGYSAYDREKFLSLGGFHPIYSPFYFEDRDIGYKALKTGWKNLLEPESIVFHKGEQTSGKINKKYVEYIKFRNRLVFYISCYENLLLTFIAVLKAVINTFFSFRWYSFSAFCWLYKNRARIFEKKHQK
ncbi:MAG: glycosyltransferase family 2 protein [Candidatus Omnitrophica bacterium]|nr:glycosyltransferase family 2 protein [Candidatus Omnitrophota bacterium]